MAKFATTRKTTPVDVRAPADVDAPADVLARVDALRARAVRVEFSDELADVNFTTNERGVFAMIGAMTRPNGPKGPATFVVYDGDEVTQRAMLDIVEYETNVEQWKCACGDSPPSYPCECPGRPNFPNGCRGRLLMGGVSEYYVEVSLRRAGWFMERVILRQQLENRLTCRECSAPVRSYKVLRGGWVCDGCAADEVDAPEAKAMLDCLHESAELQRRACAAEEAGDTAEARRLRKAADDAGSDERIGRRIWAAQLDLEIACARETLRELEERRQKLGD